MRPWRSGSGTTTSNNAKISFVHGSPSNRRREFSKLDKEFKKVYLMKSTSVNRCCIQKDTSNTYLKSRQFIQMSQKRLRILH
jgi:hypothetical protein